MLVFRALLLAITAVAMPTVAAAQDGKTFIPFSGSAADQFPALKDYLAVGRKDPLTGGFAIEAITSLTGKQSPDSLPTAQGFGENIISDIIRSGQGDPETPWVVVDDTAGDATAGPPTFTWAPVDDFNPEGDAASWIVFGLDNAEIGEFTDLMSRRAGLSLDEAGRLQVLLQEGIVIPITENPEEPSRLRLQSIRLVCADGTELRSYCLTPRDPPWTECRCAQSP